MGTDHEHRVATCRDAKAAILKHEKIYLNECFCRGPAKAGKTSYEYCGHPVETCMGFTKPDPDDEWQYEYREIDQAAALALYDDWMERGLPFRFMIDESWICLCCRCGCWWFRDEDGGFKRDPCLKSAEIERTDHSACALCGDCVDVCAWEARTLTANALVVDSDLCYGCGVCEPRCPEKAISMAPRA